MATNSRPRALAAVGLPLIIAAVALALRAHRLGVQSVWLDEGLSIIFARPPLPELLPRLITQDIHPPFYVVTLHFWRELAGESEFAVRFLSVAFGVLLVPLVYRLALDLFIAVREDAGEARVAGLIGALLVAVSPFLVYYSQEARNYIVVTFWTALSCFAFWRALGGHGRRWWATYAVASALVVYTHYYGGFVIAAQAAYLFLTWWQHRRHLLAWLGSLFVAGVLYLPWAVGLWGQLSNVVQNPDWWAGTIDLPTIVRRTFASFVAGSGQVAGPFSQALLVFAGLFALGLVAVLARGGLRSRRGELFLLLYAVVPLLIVYAITASNPKFAERYLIIISPGFYLVLARGLAALYGLGRRFKLPLAAPGLSFACLAGTAVAVALSATATWRVYYGPEWAKDDFRGAIKVIEEAGRVGDFVILIRDAYHPFEYYYQGDLPWRGFDPAGPNSAPDVNFVAGQLNQMLKGRQRVWLLLWQEEVVDPNRTVAGLLRKFGRQVELDTRFPGVRLELYELPAGVTFSADPQQRLDVRYENGLLLLGQDLLTPSVAAGQTIDTALYWRVDKPLGAEVGVNVLLKDERGFTWASETHRPTGEYLPVARWPLGKMIRGDSPLRVPPGTPPGRYTLELNVHLSTSLRELSRVMPSGQPVGTRLALAQVEVTTAAGTGTRPSADELGIAQVHEVSLVATDGGTPVRLLGLGELPGELSQGAIHDLSLYWEAGAAGRDDYEAAIELVGGQTYAVVRSVLTAGYSVASWRQGERLRGQYRLVVPPTVPPGDYELRVAVSPAGQSAPLRTTDGAESVALGTVRVVGPRRLLEPPQVGQLEGAKFGGVAELYGYTLSGAEAGVLRVRPGDTLTLTLAWRALATADTSYTVFVHLADASHRPWAQHDSPPAAGARPTTGWVAGEYVLDERQLAVKAGTPPGRYTLLVGLYGPDGQRLAAGDAAGHPLGTAAALAGVEVEVLP